MQALIASEGALGSLFVVWNELAMPAAAVPEQINQTTPNGTNDLGNAVSINMAWGRLIKLDGTQRPYDQGKAAATAAHLALLGRPVPLWIALPGLAFVRNNVVEPYQSIWHAPAHPIY